MRTLLKSSWYDGLCFVRWFRYLNHIQPVGKSYVTKNPTLIPNGKGVYCHTSFIEASLWQNSRIMKMYLYLLRTFLETSTQCHVSSVNICDFPCRFWFHCVRLSVQCERFCPQTHISYYGCWIKCIIFHQTNTWVVFYVKSSHCSSYDFKFITCINDLGNFYFHLICPTVVLVIFTKSFNLQLASKMCKNK